MRDVLIMIAVMVGLILVAPFLFVALYYLATAFGWWMELVIEGLT